MNIDDFIKQIALQFKTSIQEAWWITEAITKKGQAQLISEKNINLSDAQTKQLKQWVHDYTVLQKPLQYILGKVNFCGLEIFVEPPILIPRNETEYWCDWLLKQLSPAFAKATAGSPVIHPDKSLNIMATEKKLNILDMCTGSGCIGITLAKNFPESTVWTVDISEQAIELTKKNARHNNVKNLIAIYSDLFKSLTNLKFDLIVSNPPYIDSNFYENLDKSVKDWEDKQALISEDFGLEIIKKIITQAPNFLKINKEFQEKNVPQFVMEIDITQGEIVKKLLEQSNFLNVKVHKDLTGRDRFVSAGR